MTSIGLPEGELYLVDYQPDWPELFEDEAHLIREACGDRLLLIEHIGSTSVRGLAAKPILDIMPLLANFEDGFELTPSMEALGYESSGEFGIEGRHYFAKGSPRTHHVHMYETGDSEAVRRLLFRDYLRTHSDVAGDYARLKRRLAEELTRTDHSEAKTDFIAEVLALAGYSGPES